MAIKQGATCIDAAIHTTLLTLSAGERHFSTPFTFLFHAKLLAEFSEPEDFLPVQTSSLRSLMDRFLDCTAGDICSAFQISFKKLKHTLVCEQQA